MTYGFAAESKGAIELLGTGAVALGGVQLSEVWIWRRRGRRWLRGFTQGVRLNSTTGKALFFCHIPKSGGTSFISSMRTMIPRRLTAMEKSGNISVALAERLVAEGLKPGTFIAGHPEMSAALPLRGITCMSVLLREPAEHAISNYLWVRDRKHLPDHAVAKNLGFREFLLERPYFAIFQTGSLHVGIQQSSLGRTEDLIERLPMLLDYLREFDIVGTTDKLSEFLLRNCDAMGLTGPPSLPHFLKAGASATDRQSMREQYHDLQSHPTLGPLLAAEQELYRQAESLEEAQRSADGLTAQAVEAQASGAVRPRSTP